MDSVQQPGMEDDLEYQEQLALFVRSSTEKGVELVKIGEIIADLKHRRNFLDIGAGGGDLAIPVSQSFRETTVVEPNEKQVKRLGRRCPHFRICHDCWDNVDLTPSRYDFILCSHVLYYIREDNWMATIEKAYSHLEDGGWMAIVLQSPLGEVADFFNEFTHYDVNVLELWKGLIHRYGEECIKVAYFLNEIWTENLEDMVKIGLFLLIDRKFKEHKERIGSYIESRHRVAGGYRMVQDEILLAVKKTPKQGL